jgi:Glycosyl hydrolase family 26
MSRVFFIIMFLTVFCSLFLSRAMAAQIVVTKVEAEGMSLPAGSTVVSDAGASGGKAIRLTQTGTVTQSIVLSSPANTVSVRVRGLNCNNAWPLINVLVDGTAVMSSKSVSSTTWTSYGKSVSLPAGGHTLSVAYTNSAACGRDFYFDVTTFYGQSQPSLVTFGRTAIGIGGFAASSADSKRVNKFTASSSGVAKSVSLYVKGDGSPNSQRLRAVIYSDLRGSPGPLLNFSDELTVNGSDAPAWRTFVMPDTPITANAAYWVGIISNSVSYVAWFAYDSVTGALLKNSDSYADGPSNPFGSATGIDSTGMSIFVSYQPAPAPPPKSNSILWGALMDGDNTYGFYYGNPAPNGQPWTDAPWGNTGNTWDRFEQNAGKHVSICTYSIPSPWLQTSFAGSTADICTSRGALAVLSVSTGSTALRDIAAGKYDSAIRTWANNIKAWGRPVFLRLDPEMNGAWETYGPGVNGNTPQDFINMWRHYHDLVVGQGATNVTWLWNPNLGASDYGRVTSLDEFYPGDTYVDWTGLDGFNQGTGSVDFASIYGLSYDLMLSVAPTKPMAILEIASQEFGGEKAAWIRDFFNQLQTNFTAVKMFLWFNWRIPYNGTYREWPIESSTSSQASFASGISSPYFAPGSSTIVNLPKLSKIQPLP